MVITLITPRIIPAIRTITMVITTGLTIQNRTATTETTEGLHAPAPTTAITAEHLPAVTAAEAAHQPAAAVRIRPITEGLRNTEQ